jgi:hypothetical protein
MSIHPIILLVYFMDFFMKLVKIFRFVWQNFLEGAFCVLSFLFNNFAFLLKSKKLPKKRYRTCRCLWENYIFIPSGSTLKDRAPLCFIL